jgi:hypothetical protein
LLEGYQKSSPFKLIYINNTPRSLALIQSLHEGVKEELEEEEAAEVKPFDTSGGLFHHFQMWYGFKNVKTQGEAGSIDVEAADAFPAELKRIVEEGRYCSK